MKPVLEVMDLSVSAYGVPLIHDVSFQILPKETLALVGESGCGKSITAQAIIQLFNSDSVAISSGKILFGDKNLVEEPALKLRKIRGKDLAFVQQNPQNSLNPTLTIGSQLMECIKPELCTTKHQKKELASEILFLVGISDVEARFFAYPRSLSGGMRQRVLIAMAVINNPKLLIADEPTTALDVTIQAQILDLLLSLQEKTGMSMLFISHDMAAIARIAHRVAVMYAGSLVESGEINDIFYTPAHPYTKMLLSCLNSGVGIKGAPPHPALRNQTMCPFAPRCPKAMDICRKQAPPVFTTANYKHESRCWLSCETQEVYL
jgi:oligopeptide/dipeptide ABC transporter ATP-binding protein